MYIISENNIVFFVYQVRIHDKSNSMKKEFDKKWNYKEFSILEHPVPCFWIGPSQLSILREP